MLPKTPLLAAPADVEIQLGVPMRSKDVIDKLIRANSKLCVAYPWHLYWFDTADSEEGYATLWEGQPFDYDHGARKIAGFHLGMMPEFTQIAKGGIVLRRGWRDLLRKVVGAKAASKYLLERLFNVQLDYAPPDRKYCYQCLNAGKVVVSDGGKRGLCIGHTWAAEAAEKAKGRREEEQCQRSLSKAIPRRAESPAVQRCA